MKKLVCLFLIIGCLSCNPTNTEPNPQPTNYYFDCTVDGKHIRSEYVYPPATNTGISMSAYVATTISLNAGASYCNTPGLYCFSFTSDILAQTIGNHVSNNFRITTTEGSTSNIYDIYYPTVPKSVVTIVITDIIRSNNYTPGTLKGTFSGTVYKWTSFPTPPIPITLAGSFVIPLY